MSDCFKSLASVFRAESANVGGPMQASLARMADRLDEMAAVPCCGVQAFCQGDPLPQPTSVVEKDDSDTVIPNDYTAGDEV